MDNNSSEFGLLLSLGAAVIIVIELLLTYFLLRCRHGNPLLDRRRWANDRAIGFGAAHLNHDSAVIGIDGETLDSFPKMLYSDKVCQSFKSAEGNELDEAEDNNCCSICLSDYKESEVVKVIPDCDHMFHIDCIDQWLCLHATCPICRTSPLPSRSSSSLAQEARTTTIVTVLEDDSFRLFPE